MAEETDYMTLGLVAIVAVVAIVSMYQYAEGGIQAPKTLQETAPDSTSPLTGAVTAGQDSGTDAQTVEQHVIVGQKEGEYDYNGDGVLDAKDSEILSKAVTRGPCPQGTDCDVDNDGDVDLRDLGLFNSMLYDEQRREASSQDAPQETGSSDSPLTGAVVDEKGSDWHVPTSKRHRRATRLA